MVAGRWSARFEKNEIRETVKPRYARFQVVRRSQSKVLSMNSEMEIPIQSKVDIHKPQELLVGCVDYKSNDERHSQQSL